MKKPFRRLLSVVLAMLLLMSSLPPVSVLSIEGDMNNTEEYTFGNTESDENNPAKNDMFAENNQKTAPSLETKNIATSTESKTATTFTCGIYTYSVNDDEATITACSTSASGNIIIPDILDDYTVTGIGSYAFYNHKGITSITIPNTVTEIEYHSFLNCSSLENVVIPSSVTSIGYGILSGCSSLTEITLPFVGLERYTTSNRFQYPFGVVFGNESYTGGTATKQYYYGNSGTDIKDETYYIPSSLRKVTITDCSYIQYGAFYNCTRLSSIIIFDSVTNIGSNAFYNCTGLTSIIIPDAVIEVGSNAFYKTKWLDNQPDGLVYAGKVLYRYKGDCPLSVTIEDGTTGIVDSAFYNCTDLTSITIPKTVTFIGSGVFSGCSSLAEITIPFVGDKRHSKTDTYQYPFGYIFGSSSYTGSIAAYQTYYTNNTSSVIGTTFHIPSSLKKVTITDCEYLSRNAFQRCTGITTIILPDSVTDIGDYAFFCCSGLNTIVIPNSVTDIGDYAFSYCTGLSFIKIPNSVSSIGKHSFYNCDKLISVTIGNNVNTIDDYSFSGCASITSIIIPDSVASFGSYVFENCTSLKSVEIGNSVTLIKGYAFYKCTGLKSVLIGNSVKSIGTYAFCDCSSLTNITIPSSMTSIENNAFLGCKKLVEIINHSMLNIKKESTYNGGVGSNALIIHSGDNSVIRSIEDFSFISIGKDTYLLEYTGANNSIKLPEQFDGNAYSVYKYAFENSTKLTSITIPNGVKSIENDAFYGCKGLKTVNYLGTKAQWDKISIGSNNTYLTNATRYYNGHILTVKYVDWQGNELFDAVEQMYSAGDNYSYTSPEKEYYESDKEMVSGVMPNYDLTITVTYFEKVILASGKCGENISWKLYENGDLVFKGYGIIPNYTSQNAPWYNNADKVRNIRIPSGITGIGNYAFQNCTNATNIEFGYGVTAIGKYAFSGCVALPNISLPDSLKKIDEGAFSGCTGLKSVTLSEYLTEIGAKAFYGCTALTKVTLGGNVSAIGNQAFDNCAQITSVLFRGSPLTSAGSNIFGNTNSGVMVYYYSTVSGWEAALIDGTHYLGYKAFPVNAIQKQDAVSAGSVYYIKVIDKYNTPLAGAVVKLGDTTYTTNSFGFAYFEKPAGSTSLEISCSNHNNYSDSAYIASQTQMMDIITLSDKPSTVQGISCGGKSIASSVCSLNCNSNDTVSIVVSGYSKYTILKYELLQENRTIKTIETSLQTCTFTVPSNSFEEGQNVFVKMYTSDGNTVASALNIDVMALANISESKLLDELSSLNLLVDFGDFGKVNLPINFRNDNKAKIYTYVDGRTIRVGINLDVNSLIKNFKTGSNSSLQKYLEKQVNQSLTENSFGWDEKGTGFKFKVSGYIDIEYLGNGQYYVKTSYVKVAVSAKLAFGGEASFYGLVGVYFKATLSADTSLALKITRYVPESGFNVDNVTLSLENKLELEAGIYILFRFGEASVYGNLRMGFDLQLYPKTEFEHVYIKGEIGARWSLFWGLYSGSHKFAEGTIFEYPAAQKSFIRSVYSEALRSAYCDPDNYSILDRSYLDNRSDWLSGVMRSVGSAGDQYYDLQTDTYGNIAPKIVTAGDTTVMVWLDDNPERDFSNFQTLYYSAYNSEQNVWSAPRQLDQNNTFDCEFDLVTDGERIYVAYTEQTNVLSDMESFDIEDANAVSDYVTGIEVAFAEYKNGSFTKPVYITNNNVCEIMPSISIVAGQPIISWIVSDNLGLYDSGNKDSAYYCEYTENGWSDPILIAENQNSLSSIAIGAIGDSIFAAYLLDSDNNATTSNDSSLVLIDQSGNALLVDTGVLSDVSFTSINGKDVLVWIADGSIFYLDDIQGKKINLLGDTDASVSKYQVLSVDTQTVITFVTDAGSGTDVFAVTIDEEGNTSEVIRLTNTEGYIEHYDVSCKDGSIIIAFNETKTLENNSESVSTTTNLRYVIYSFDHDISLLSLAYDADEISESGDLDFTAEVRNNGISDVSDVTVSLYDQIGELVTTKQIYANIKPGCSEEINFSISFPMQLSSQSYTVEIVSSDEKTDKDMSDNSLTVTLSYCDLAVDVEQKIINNKNQLLILVSNTGSLSAFATLNVFAGNEDGTLLDTIDLGQIEAGHAQQCSVELEGLITEDDYVITCVVSSPVVEAYTTNNTDSVKLLRIDTANYIETEEESIENPVLHTSAASYDKYTDDTISIEIEVGKDKFHSITGLLAGADYLFEDSIVVLQKSYLDTLNGQVKLDFVFDYGTAGLISRSFQIDVYDSTPTSIDGIISIDGDITVGTTITANISSISPSNAEVSYNWMLNGETVGNESSFAIPLNACGKTLTLKVIGIDGFSGEIECTNIVKLQSQSAPKSIVVQSMTDTGITVAAISGAEYSMDENTWQQSPVFDNLLPDTNYTIYARYTATEYAQTSDSISIVARTLPKVIDYENGEYHIDGNCVIHTDSKTLVKGSDDSVIPNDGSVTSIGKKAFSNCNELVSIIIPESILRIDDMAFYRCNQLTSVYIYSQISEFGVSSIPKETKIYCFKDSTAETYAIENGNDYEYILQCDDGLNWIFDSTTHALIISGYGQMDNYGFVINGYSMFFRDAPWKTFYDKIDSVIIRDGITSIGAYAFADCTGLTSITIPNSVTSIGSDAFRGCTGIESIIVDSGNLAYHSAGNCLIETESKTLIYGCKNSITPNDGSVTSIVTYAFAGCTGLKSITIPNSVTSIGAYAFTECTGLTSIAISNSVTSIGTGAFQVCTGLTSITIPNSVTSIGAGAFTECTGLTSITISNSVTSIDSNAFRGCTGLTNITIPASVTSIGNYAFYNCTRLTSITIPDRVTSIGNYAFYYCTKFNDVYYTGSEEQKDTITIGSKNDCLSAAAWHYNCNPDNPTCEHSETKIENAQKATCTKDGYTGDTVCTDCGYTLKQGDVIPALGHDYQSVVVEPTCTCEGHTIHTCSICGESYIDNYTPTISHSASGWEDDEQNHWHTCSMCETQFDLAVHTGGTATCADKAICSVCGGAYGELDANNHAGTTYKKGENAATCCEAGYTGDTYCTDCGEKIATGSAIPATGNHVDADGKWESDGTQHWHTCYYGTHFDVANHTGGTATCTEKAKCSICGSEYGDYAKHQLTHHGRVEPDYENDGNIEYWTCDECGKYFSDSEGNNEIIADDVIIAKLIISEYQFLDGEVIIEAPEGAIPEGSLFDVQKIVPPPAEVVEKVKEQMGSSSEVLAYYEIRLSDTEGELIIHLDGEITIKIQMPEKYIGSKCVKILQEDETGKIITMESWWEGEYLCYKTDWLEIYN